MGRRSPRWCSSRSGASLDLAALQEHARAGLAGYKLPRRLCLVDEVQRGPNGKPDYPWAQARAREDVAADSGFVGHEPAMRVLVTGGTGFTGAHTTKALVDAGHEVVLLVRSAEKIDVNVRPLGVDVVDHVVGDMTDRASVALVLEGCDAVVHTAALVGLGTKDADEVLRANPLGANVLGLAAERGLDPIVHVSSLSALYDFDEPVLHRDLPLVQPKGRTAARRWRPTASPGGGRPKAALSRPPTRAGSSGRSRVPRGRVQRGARQLRQNRRHGDARRRAGQRSTSAISPPCMPCVSSLVPGSRAVCLRRPRVDLAQTAAVLRQVTGRRMPALPIPGAAYRGAGRLLDWLAERTSVESSNSEESMRYASKWVPIYDTPVGEELGFEWRHPFDLDGRALLAPPAGVPETKQVQSLATD